MILFEVTLRSRPRSRHMDDFFFVSGYSEIKAVLVSRDKDFREKLTKDVRICFLVPCTCLLSMAETVCKEDLKERVRLVCFYIRVHGISSAR